MNRDAQKNLAADSDAPPGFSTLALQSDYASLSITDVNAVISAKNRRSCVPNLLPYDQEASFPDRIRLHKLRVYGRADAADRGAGLSIFSHHGTWFYSACNALRVASLTSFHFAVLRTKPNAVTGYFVVTPLPALSTCATPAKNFQRNFHM